MGVLPPGRTRFAGSIRRGSDRAARAALARGYLTYGTDLLANESHPGAHTIDRHVAKTLVYLKGRLVGDSAVAASSSFYDLAHAQAVVDRVFDKPTKGLLKWLRSGGRGPKEIGIEMPYPVGKTMTRAPSGRLVVRETSRAVVSLRRDSRGVHVLTCYPEARP
jgi:hypothetical protein